MQLIVDISNDDYNKMSDLQQASIKGVENWIHNISKEKRTTAIVKENKKKEQKEILPIKEKEDIKLTHLVL